MVLDFGSQYTFDTIITCDVQYQYDNDIIFLLKLLIFAPLEILFLKRCMTATDIINVFPVCDPQFHIVYLTSY